MLELVSALITFISCSFAPVVDAPTQVPVPPVRLSLPAPVRGETGLVHVGPPPPPLPMCLPWERPPTPVVVLSLPAPVRGETGLVVRPQPPTEPLASLLLIVTLGILLLIRKVVVRNYSVMYQVWL